MRPCPWQVTNQESWQASCLSKGGVCIVAALAAGEAQAAQLETVRSAAAGRAEQPLHFSWFQAAHAGAAGQFAAQLGLDAGQAPALVAVAPRKERFAVMTGRFDKVSALGQGGMWLHLGLLFVCGVWPWPSLRVCIAVASPDTPSLSVLLANLPDV